MKALLVYPEFPDTFWGFKHALKFISKKASLPPLGLLTVAALLPPEWESKLVDMNTALLEEEDVRSSDIVFISAISIQKKAVHEVVARFKRAGVTVVAGGPLFTTGHEEFGEVDHFVLDEAELTLPQFLGDLRRGAPQRVYRSELRADLRATPLPKWELIDMRQYASMNVQYSRGCPFDCEFCDITLLYGRESRTKDADQMLAELEALYRRGWRGAVFFVDDNFIGNKDKLKKSILPAITRWMKEKKRPFVFNTQVSINIADDAELMRMMTEAGFVVVFVGIETPSEKSLEECGKVQNRRRDLLASVRKIQGHGLEVQGGFIMGFDSDPPDIFERQFRFVQESGIVTAMVGLLNPMKGTRLYRRMEKEDRLLKGASGDNTDGSVNFIPRMGEKALVEGYKKVVAAVYVPRNYYQRIQKYFEHYIPSKNRTVVFHASYVAAFVRSVVRLGVLGRERFYFWRLLLRTIFTRPRLLSQVVTFMVYGYHYRKIYEREVR